MGISAGDNVTALSAHMAVGGKCVYKAKRSKNQAHRKIWMTSADKIISGGNPKVQTCLSIFWTASCTRRTNINVLQLMKVSDCAGRWKDSPGEMWGRLTDSELLSLRLLSNPVADACRNGFGDKTSIHSFIPLTCHLHFHCGTLMHILLRLAQINTFSSSA